MRLVTQSAFLSLLAVRSVIAQPLNDLHPRANGISSELKQSNTVNARNAALVPCPWTNLAPLSHEQTVTNWYALWAGNYSALNSTVMPSIQVYQDRFPTGKGSAPLPIGNASAFLDFVKLARADFETYAFIDDFHFAVENMIALRWTLNATFAGSKTAYVQAHSSGYPLTFVTSLIFPIRKLEKGSHVAYNGTDIMLLDPCSGLVQQVLSAQDLITYYHVLQQPLGAV